MNKHAEVPFERVSGIWVAGGIVRDRDRIRVAMVGDAILNHGPRRGHVGLKTKTYANGPAGSLPGHLKPERPALVIRGRRASGAAGFHGGQLNCGLDRLDSAVIVHAAPR